MTRIRPPVLVAAAAMLVLVVAGVAMTILGMPENTPGQRTLLTWSQPVFAAAALIAIGQMSWERRAWRRRSFQIVAVVAGVLVGAAIVGFIGDAVTGTWAWTRNGLATGLGWAGIALLFGWLVVDSTRREAMED